MMNFDDSADSMSELFSDYSMKLFCINEYENFDMFQTELREVFTALNYRSDKPGMQKLMQENEAYHHLDRDSVRILSVLLKQPKIWEEREKYMSKNAGREEYDMCLALREWAADERAEGRAEGRAEAFNLVMQIISVLRGNNTLSDEAVADICNCTVADVETVRKVFEM